MAGNLLMMSIISCERGSACEVAVGFSRDETLGQAGPEERLCWPLCASCCRRWRNFSRMPSRGHVGGMFLGGIVQEL